MTETETEVTQADRENSWPYRPTCYKVDDYTDWMAGKYDMSATIIKGFARHRTQSAAHNVPVLLEAHFKRMQEACANYVEPTTYIARHPVGELCKWNTEFPEPDKHQSIDGALARTRRRDQAFINDIIYMLDGPEQRAAIAQAQEPE